EAVDMVRWLAAGAGGLHEEGLVHRNIKPDNVRFSQNVPSSPALSDIWIDTDRRGKPPSRPDSVEASLGFAAPERLLTGRGGGGTDVEARACIRAGCVAGCMPIADHARGRPLLGEAGQDACWSLWVLGEAASAPSPVEPPPGGREVSFALARLEKTLGLAGA